MEEKREAPIKAVIFDSGGVLERDSDRAVIYHILRKFGVPPVAALKELQNLVPLLEVGRLSEEDFWRKFSAKCGKPLPKNWAELFREPYVKNFKAIEGTLDIARELRNRGCKIGVLSNTIAAHDHPKKQKMFGEFQGVVLSYASGVRKPEKQAYLAVVDLLGVKPEEAVHVDNEPRFVEAAKKAGLHGVLFKNPSQLRRELRKMRVL